MKLEKSHKFYLSLGVLFIAIGWFYWFQWRPVAIRSNCHRWIVDLPGEVEGLRSEGQIRIYEALFDRCLHEKGLK